MIIKNRIGYSYNDITIVPEIVTDINSRSECNPFVEDNKLPLFASPMSTITNVYNIDIWKNNGITPIIPRNIDYEFRKRKIFEGEWVALSLNEFKSLFIEQSDFTVNDYDDASKYTYNICVDLANGHMKSLYETINKAKEISRKIGYNLVIMTGNIANPETYEWICENADVDYIRLSIGSGAGCLTTSNTSIHYPIATLIEKCNKFRQDISDYKIGDNGKCVRYAKYDKDGESNITYYSSCPKIVADGGIRGYADVIKAIGLGADYVMVGSVFASLLESAAPLNIECYNSHYKYSFNNNEYGMIDNGVITLFGIWQNTTKGMDCHWESEKRNFIQEMKDITKEFYGMSTKKAQKLINPNAIAKTSEGCTKYVKVKETVQQWTENMKDYLKSAMSYTNKRTLDEFRGNVDFIVNSSCTIMSVNK